MSLSNLEATLKGMIENYKNTNSLRSLCQQSKVDQYQLTKFINGKGSITLKSADRILNVIKTRV